MNEAKNGRDVLRPQLNHQASFFDSAKAVLGHRWYISISILLIFIFWPVVFFWRFIKFNPALFVEEWLKLGVGGVLLYFILEIMRHRSISFATRESISSLLLNTYIMPLKGAIDALREFRQALEKGDREQATSKIQTAWRAWKVIDQALSDDALQLPLEREVRSHILQCRIDLNPRLSESVLRSLYASRDIEDFNPTEFDDLVRRLNSFLHAIDSLNRNSSHLEEQS